MPTRAFELDRPLDLARTLFPLRRGTGDLTMRIAGSEAVRATRTAHGPATIHLRVTGRRLRAEAWGPGAAAALEHAPELAGAADEAEGFDPGGVIRDVWRRHRGVRLTRSGSVVEALIPAVLEQKVTGLEARRAYRGLTRALAEPAPGPFGLLLPPDPERVASMPYHAVHRFGIERRRAEVLRAIAGRASRLDRLGDAPLGDVDAALRALPGIGAWTAAEVRRLALGDPDAVSVGDFHLKHLVAWALAGEPRGTDERMLRLLEPYRGHRGRVQLLLEASGIRAPRFGPRLAPRGFARQ